MLKIASLFSGIGGFEKGIMQAADKLNIDVEFVFASEFDPDAKSKTINKQPARQIYRKNFNRWPEGDITQIDSADVPEHDILVGGPPCQGFSSAGKREGLCGAKGSMFFELIRIVREKQPKLIFLENVRGILSSAGGWDFARILVELESAGYWIEWQILDTASFLPQRRERVFIIGHLAGSKRCGRKIFPLGQSSRLAGKKEPAVYTLDAHYYKGVAQQHRTVILCDSGPGRKLQTRDETIAPLRANTGAGSNNIVCHSDMAILKTNNMIRRLIPLEVEKLQGFPPGWTAKGIDGNGNTVKISDTQRYKCCGNAVSVPVIEFIFKHILEAW